MMMSPFPVLTYLGTYLNWKVLSSHFLFFNFR
jgi:hypothetical protein